MTAREHLQQRRASQNFDIEIGGLRYVCTFSRYADGRVSEIFLSNHRVNSGAGIMASDQAVLASLALPVDQPERWPKTERRMLGVVHRAAVMLDPIGPKLAIGEGIETCMAARKLGVRPAWALGSVGCISGFPIIDSVKQLTILGEAGQASADAIKFCARRWRRAGRGVYVAMPDIGGDLNDELMLEAQ
jgi:Toprim domain